MVVDELANTKHDVGDVAFIVKSLQLLLLVFLVIETIIVTVGLVGPGNTIGGH